MGQDQQLERSIPTLLEAANMTGTDRWWRIDVLVQQCVQEPDLPFWLGTEVALWVANDEAEPAQWLPVVRALADLSTRYPSQHLADAWLLLAGQLGDDWLSQLAEADRLAAADPDGGVRRHVDAAGVEILARGGRGRSAIRRAQQILDRGGPDQAVQALVVGLLAMEGTPATSALYAESSLKAARERGEKLDRDLRLGWAQQTWRWVEELQADAEVHQRELVKILDDVAANQDFWPDGDEGTLFRRLFAQVARSTDATNSGTDPHPRA